MSTRIALLLAGVVVAAAPTRVRADTPDGPICCTDDGLPCSDDATDVVGFHECPKFGSWGHRLTDPYVFVDVGVNDRHFAGAAPMATALARATHPISTSKTSGHDALMLDERIGFGVSRGLYAAFDFELGDLDSSHEEDLVLDGLASLGVRLPVGPLMLAGEVSGGVMESSYATQANIQVDGVLEARARVDLWLAPWFTVGGMAGKSLLDHGDWVAGLYLGFHSWGYAGDRWSASPPE